MRVAVTGATGNVGSAVLRALGDEPEVTDIVGIARRAEGPAAPKVRWHAADVRDRAALDEAFRDVDAVVHLAWAIQPSRDREATRSVNVDGSANVFAAAEAAGARALVHLSSVGAYAPAVDAGTPVTEEHPATGIPTSFYSVDKAEVERRLDAVAERDAVRTVRLRPGLIFQRDAASEIRRLFAGPFLPGALLRPGRLPVLPRVGGVRFQVVHADDVADVVRRVLVDPDARGAYNVATDDVVDLASIARVLRARATVPVPFGIARRGADLAWRARLSPTPAGWLDIAARCPLLDATRARRELGWTPSRPGHDALEELLVGLADGAGGATPALRATAGGRGRLREVLSGLGGRDGAALDR